MMKAQAPTFEKCLFGASCEPIPVKAYGHVSPEKDAGGFEISIVAMSENNNGEMQSQPLIDSNTSSGSMDNDNIETKSIDQPQCAIDEASPSKSLEGSVDKSDGNDGTLADRNNLTPPQSPLRQTQPLRPKKSNSASKSKEVEFPVAKNNRGSKSNSTKGDEHNDADSDTPQNTHTINLQELRRLSSAGVPDDCTLRPIAWRVLLGYLPLDTSQWQSALDKDRALYRNLVSELFTSSEGWPFEDEGRKLRGKGLQTDGRSIQVSPHTSPNKDAPARINEAVEALAKTTLLDKAEQEKEDKREIEDEQRQKQQRKGELEIPFDVREQWRKTGRDPESLVAAMGGKRSENSLMSRHFNALLVTNNDTASTRTNDAVVAKKANDALHLTGEISENIDQKWRHFLDNASLLDEIRKDVERTHPDLQFFLEPRDHVGLRRYAAMERILFVWAKLNKGVRYVQGMNEIVGTMYFVLANDENEEWAAEAEADTYFLFNTLMVEMRDIFVPDLDEADTGIQGRMANMLALLSLHDPEVRCHLDDSGIDPGFYSIRWLTTFLSREFLLPDTIRLWDSMLASTHKDNFMRYVCVCMVMIIRESLLKSDFGACLKLLQAYPPTDVDKLLESSRALWIYESQVTLACHKGGISLNQALTTISPPPAVIMAYGLQGGLALDQIERMRQEIMNATSSSKRNKTFRKVGKKLNSTSVSNSKSFFGGLFHNKK